MEASSELIISLGALAFSIAAFIISFIHNRNLARENIRIKKAAYYMERNSDVESKLAKWPEALKFYGIDLQDAKKDNISKEQITYLILSLNALYSYCQAEGISIYEEIRNNDYRKRMFSQKETRKTWEYAQNFFQDHVKSEIDKYLKEEYSDEYENKI